MIPIKTEVLNFGAIPSAVMSFEEITLAAIVGQNGAGKSTLATWAPLFALFGVTKNGCSVDDMVRAGSTEMHVFFTFEHDGAIYRVMRTRSTKGRGKSGLEFQKQDGEEWLNISGASIAETQERIIELLNLNAETFCSSSMILQGKSNEFTEKPAGQRKDILAQIMGLDVYDKLLAAAKEKVSEVTLQIATKEADLNSAKEKAEGLADAERELEELKLSEAESKESIENIRALAAQLDSEITELEKSSVAYEAAEKELAAVEEKLSAADKEKRLLCIEISKLTLSVSREDEVKKKIEGLEEIAKTVATKEAELAVLPDTNFIKAVEEDNDAMDALKAAEATLKVAEENEVLRLSMSAAAAEAEILKSSIDAMEQKRPEHDRLTEEIEQRKTDIAMLKAKKILRVKSFEERKAELEKKVHILEDANCVDIEKAECLFLKDAKEAKVKLESMDDELVRIVAETSTAILDAELQSLQEDREAVGFDAATLAELKKKYASREKDAKRFAELSSAPEILEMAKKSADAAKERSEEKRNAFKAAQAAEKKVNGLRNEIQLMKEGLQPEKGVFPLLLMKDSLKRIGEDKTNLAVKEDRVKNLDAHILSLSDEKDAVNKRISEIAFSADTLEDKKQDRRSAGLLLTAEDNALKKKTEKIALAKAKHEELLKAKKKLETLMGEMEKPYKERHKWDTLVKAFSRNGIPAYIIENAVPELERIANDILGRMSAGRHYLRFETQQEKKGGGTKETLEIVVGDWSGERVYETFSGGEQLRIDLSIRFALAQLLASRAGSRVEWLTIDEGLSSQDQQHRDMVIESIKSVADMFKKVLVITHIESARASFDEIISVDVEESGERVVNVA